MANANTLRFPSKPFTSTAAIVLAACWLSGCASHDAGAPTPSGAAGATSGDDVPTKAPIGNPTGGKTTPCDEDPVCKSLNALGVGTETTPRLDENGDPLPDTFNPLGGKRRALDPVSELFVGGAHLLDIGSEGEAAVLELHADDEHETSPDNQLMRDLDDFEWTEAELRAAVAADLDGDGAQEIAGVWLDDGELKLRVIANPSENDEQSDTPLGEYAAESVALAAGDFDGDGRDELAVAAVLEAETQILFVENGDDGYAIDADRTRRIERASQDSRLDWQLASGNIDYDDRSELVLVSNDVTDWDAGLAVSDYFVWDDEDAEHAELDSGEVVIRDVALYPALRAGAAIVDVDKDGLGEVVLAGMLTPGLDGSIDYGVVALDDARHGFESIAVKRFASSNDMFRSSVTVSGLDIDGDRVSEVLVNERVLANLTEPEGDDAWPTRYFFGWSSIGTTFRESAVTVGDMNGDGRDDIVVSVTYPNGTDARPMNALRVLGLPGPRDAANLEQLMPWINFEDSRPPLLVAANVDKDTAVLEFSPVERRLVFSEPVVVAALAAPPCAEDISQNVEACTTSFGRSSSAEVEVERSVTLSASLMVGTSVEDRTFTQSELDIEATREISIGHKQSVTYATEKSLSYTTGSLEDAVIFTSIPYDQYVYHYVSNPNPDLVGQEIVVSVPREPVTLMVERSFYNENAVEGAPKIDDEVFRHAVGSPASYPSRSEKDSTLERFGGMEHEAVSVDQGSGEKELEIAVGSQFASGLSMAMKTEFGLETTLGGLQVGFTMGREAEYSLTVTGGSTTSYAGSVGALDLDSEQFGEHRYSFGLFTYVHELPDGRAFDVVNYWVE